MSVKFIEYWDLQPNAEKKYVKYLMKEWIPGMNELGVTILAIWNTLVGAGPQFISEGVADDLGQIEQALRGEHHSKLNEGLLNWVESYKSRVIVPTGLIPCLIGEPKHQSFKFNQRWDVITDSKDEFEAFLTKEFVPGLERMGIVIGGHWKTLIGPKPHKILEGRAGTLDEIRRVIDSPTFAKLKKKLLNYVTPYESRIMKLQVLRMIGRTGASYDYL